MRPLLAALALLLAGAAQAQFGSFPPGVFVSHSDPAPAGCTINSVSLDNNTFPSGSASGTVVGAIAVGTAGTCAAASLSLTGADAASFQIASTNLETNGSVADGSYSINVVATIAGATGSPFSQPETITSCNDTGVTVAWAAAVVVNGGTVSTGRKAAVCTLIAGLQTDSVWTKLDRLWLLAAENAPSALTDLVATALATANGGPAFATDRGYTGVDASTTVYIDSGFNPSTGTPNFVQDSAHLSAWSVTDVTSSAPGGAVIGIQAVGGNPASQIYPRYLDGNAYFYLNGDGNTPTGVANATATGHYVSNRTVSTTLLGYRNGSQIDSEANTSEAVENGDIFILASKLVGGDANGGAGNQIAAASIGGGLTGANVTNFYNRLRTYMTAVGVP